MNYTQKAPNYQHSFFKSPFLENTARSNNTHFSKICGVRSLSFSATKKERKGEALLVNGEVDKPAPKIPKKYQSLYTRFKRKQIIQYALTVDNTGDNIDESLKRTNVSLFHCGIQPHYQNISGNVGIKETKTSRNLKGLKSCGSHCACPDCAAKLSYIRGQELSTLMEVGRENNRSYMMIVTTIPHQPLEALQITQDQNDKLSTYIFNSKEWKKLKKDLSCRFVHLGRENMVSVKNGCIDWHPHKNYLLDFDIPMSEVMERLGFDNDVELRLYFSRLFTSLGQRYLDGENISKKLLEPYLWENPNTNQIHVKGGVSASVEFDDKYITKWGLDAEMTAGIYKNGQYGESFHPFVLADLIDKDNKEISKEHKYMFIKAFQEFVKATKGKNWFKFGRGAVAFYNENYGSDIKNESDEVALRTMEDDGSLLLELALVEWELFKPTPKKIGFALSRETKEDVLTYIFEEIEKNRILENEKSIKMSDLHIEDFGETLDSSLDTYIEYGFGSDNDGNYAQGYCPAFTDGLYFKNETDCIKWVLENEDAFAKVKHLKLTDRVVSVYEDETDMADFLYYLPYEDM